MIDTHSPYIDELKSRIAESVMHPLNSIRDFASLSDEIMRRTNETLSEATLKRLWGYVDGYDTIRESSLDILCRALGYADWHTFVADYCGKDSERTSYQVLTETVAADSIATGDRIAIEWSPNRRLVLRHDGKGSFEVVESQNSKVVAGDRFRCGFFTVGQPLYLEDFVHDGMPPVLFVVGKKGGLTKVARMKRG